MLRGSRLSDCSSCMFILQNRSWTEVFGGTTIVNDVDLTYITGIVETYKRVGWLIAAGGVIMGGYEIYTKANGIVLRVLLSSGLRIGIGPS